MFLYPEAKTLGKNEVERSILLSSGTGVLVVESQNYLIKFSVNNFIFERKGLPRINPWIASAYVFISVPNVSLCCGHIIFG